MNLPKIKTAIEQQKSRTFKLFDLPGVAKYRAWSGITIRIQARVVEGLWNHIRHV